MGVDIDDQEVFVMPLDRLLIGVAQERAGIELLVREIAEAVTLILHHDDLSVVARSGVRRPMPTIACHAPNSKTSSPTLSSSAVQPMATSVTVTPLFARTPHCLPHLSLRGVKPNHGGEDLSERVVGDCVDAILFDRLRAGPRWRPPALERLAWLRL